MESEVPPLQKTGKLNKAVCPCSGLASLTCHSGGLLSRDGTRAALSSLLTDVCVNLTQVRKSVT